MDSIEKNKKKNQILTEVCNSASGLDTYQISKITNNSIELVSYLVEEIRDEGYFELLETTSKRSGKASVSI